MLHHGKMIKKLLIEKNISQKEFSIALGYSEKNFFTNFFKEKLDQEILDKISNYFELPSNYFLENGATNSLQTTDQAELYERLLLEKEARIQEKDAYITDLRKMIALLEKNLMKS
jgi:transcriptional regulator with XRE-family HTH domain